MTLPKIKTKQIKIDWNLHLQVKVECAKRGISLTRFTEQALREALRNPVEELRK